MEAGFILTQNQVVLSQWRRGLPRTKPRRQPSSIFTVSMSAMCGNTTENINRRDLLRLLAALSGGAVTASTHPYAVEAFTRKTDFLYDSKSGSFVPPSAMDSLLRRDAGSRFDRCIVAGEVHDNICTHSAQLQIIDSARRMSDGKELMVGFEQFYRTHNHLLDDYVKGKISTTSLLKRTNWEYTWGFDSNLYTPIFEYCRLHGIRMRGLNVPRQFVFHVTKLGLAGLPAELKAFLPDNMDFSNREHYMHFVRLMTEGHHGLSHKAVLDRFYEVQVLWEEWMSQSVALSLEDNPNTRMVALIGSGHVEGRYGFPDRIEKRCNERPYTIVPRPVAWTHDDGFYMPNIPGPEHNIADLIWYTRRRIDLV